MKQTDVAIIGAATSGSYLAKLLAEKGLSVTVIEKAPKEMVGSKYDIVHIETKEFERFGIPRPAQGDASWAFEFSREQTADPMNRYPKEGYNPKVGLHMHEYTVLMNEWAESSGAKIIYEAQFKEFILTDGKITGLKYKKRGRLNSLDASVVVDCSGIPAVGRRSLPDGYGVEKFALQGDDMFYVVLRYVKIKNEADKVTDYSRGWPFYKSWIAPCQDPEGAIVGIGACHSFEHCDEVYAEMLKTVELPEHELNYIEKGFTPYRRPPYSFVADNFVVSGDAACLTKPMNGEGVTSSMVHLGIAADVIDQALRTGDTSKKALWKINTEYNRIQGADFSFLRALLTGVVNAATLEEFEYAFESGMISDELLSSVTAGGDFDPAARVLLNAAYHMITGIASGKVSKKTVGAALDALKNGGEVKELYLAFPEDPEQYARWCMKAENLWKKIGKLK
ncbi:MAG: FAD-dependent monooxygenase [Clostridia bacterium]|nr:FAD-dependent monooxygenase [Clostridia bacterium]